MLYKAAPPPASRRTEADRGTSCNRSSLGAASRVPAVTRSSTPWVLVEIMPLFTVCPPRDRGGQHWSNPLAGSSPASPTFLYYLPIHATFANTNLCGPEKCCEVCSLATQNGARRLRR